MREKLFGSASVSPAGLSGYNPSGTIITSNPQSFGQPSFNPTDLFKPAPIQSNPQTFSQPALYSNLSFNKPAFLFPNQSLNSSQFTAFFQQPKQSLTFSPQQNQLFSNASNFIQNQIVSNTNTNGLFNTSQNYYLSH